MTKQSEDVKRAAELVKTTAENTAMALNIQYMQRDIADIRQTFKDTVAKMEQAVKDLSNRDENYVSKDDFNFWRNLLVSGMIGTIFLGIVAKFFVK